MTMSKDWYNTEFEENELESKHRPPSVEYSFYTAVKTGDMETVIQNCNANFFTHLEGTGILSRNAVTNLKYHFVVTAAMLTRYCIDGGMESEQAYRLSDFYILKMDSCTTQQQIADLHHIMAKDFTGKMALQKKKLCAFQTCHAVRRLYLYPYQRTYYHRRSCLLHRSFPELPFQGVQAKSGNFHQ